MKKTIIKILVMIIISLVFVSIYLVFIKVEMTGITKIICKYFEDIDANSLDKATNTTNIKINDNSTYINEANLYPIIKYGNSFYQFAGYALDEGAIYKEKNIDLCYIVDKEDVNIEKSITEDVYELKNVSLKYAFAYKNENSYYLYAWLNLNDDTDIKSKMGNFDELFKEVNRDEQIYFDEISIFIHTSRGDTYSNKSIIGYGDIDKLLDKYITGKKLHNVGNVALKRKTLTNITQYKKYKEADISICGYMKDTKSSVLLNIDSDGYLRVCIADFGIDAYFEIDDNQIEAICQDILENFDLYLEYEKITKTEY